MEANLGVCKAGFDPRGSPRPRSESKHTISWLQRARSFSTLQGMLSRVESEAIDRIRALVDELVALAPWWAGWARPLTEAEIARFEAEHGVKLPDSYRAVLRTIGDHAPLPTRPGGALAPLADARGLSVASAAVGPLADPFPHVGDAAVELEWDEEADDYADPLWLRGCLPLTEAGCDESLVLVISGPDRGRVWRATPSGRPELHPTGLEFDRWYASELERARRVKVA
jgi:hypothetical protein